MEFQPGNKMASGGARPGAGRKPLQRKYELNKGIDQVLTEESCQAILAKILEAALQGDLKAAGFLFTHAYGRPPTPISPYDEANNEEYERLFGRPPSR